MKVKEWMQDPPQFEVIEFYETPPGEIKSVIRLSDGVLFLRFEPCDFVDKTLLDAFYITGFHSDNIGIDFEIHRNGEKVIGSCEINDIILSGQISYGMKTVSEIRNAKITKKDGK